MSVVSCGGEADAVRLLSPGTIDLIFLEQANGTDLALGLPVRFGIRYGITMPRLCMPDEKICF